MSSSIRPDARECPSCGATFPDAATMHCRQCGFTVVDPHRAHGLARRTYGEHPGQVVLRGAVGGGFLATGLAALVIAVSSFPLAACLMALFALPFGAISGAAVYRAVHSRRHHRLHVRAAQRLAADTPCVRIRDAGEGRVHVTGIARPFRLAPSWSQRASLASSLRYVDSNSVVNVMAEGGTFELDDGSGTQAFVDARYVVVLSGRSIGNEMFVPPDARIEVVGLAHMAPAMHASRDGSGLRDGARVVYIEGTPDDPVLVGLAR